MKQGSEGRETRRDKREDSQGTERSRGRGRVGQGNTGLQLEGLRELSTSCRQGRLPEASPVPLLWIMDVTAEMLF